MTNSLQSIADMQIENWTGLPEQTVEKMKEYKLFVRFGGSREQLLLRTGTYRACLETAETFYQFIVQEHLVHTTQMLFTKNLVTPDRIVIGCIRNHSYYGQSVFAQTGLWATFTIEEE